MNICSSTISYFTKAYKNVIRILPFGFFHINDKKKPIKKKLQFQLTTN